MIPILPKNGVSGNAGVVQSGSSPASPSASKNPKHSSLWPCSASAATNRYFQDGINPRIRQESRISASSAGGVDENVNGDLALR